MVPHLTLRLIKIYSKQSHNLKFRYVNDLI